MRKYRQIVTLCLAIFFTDLSNSSTIPIFPFFAGGLGASVSYIGLLASVSGISTMIFSIPLGIASDNFGRKKIMLIGMVCFVFGPLLYNVAHEPFQILPARVILGIAQAATFSVGFVYISEIAPQEMKGLAQGLYLTSMGIGFTLGPLIGGWIAKTLGFTTSFYMSSCFALFALFVLFITPEMKNTVRKSEHENFLTGFFKVLSKPKIVAASIANFFNSMLYHSTMVYFPVYGNNIGLDESQVGMGLTVRGMISTTTRIPASAAAHKVEAIRLMILGIILSACTIITIPSLENLVILSMVLGIQGLAYGIYLTSGNVYIMSESPSGLEGASIGVFSTFSNFSGIVSPIFLGLASEAWGIRNALRGSAVIAFIGVILTMIFMTKKGSPRTP